MAEQMALGRFLSMFQPATQVRRERHKTTIEAARMADTISKDRAEMKEAYWNKPKDNTRKLHFERKDATPKLELNHDTSPNIKEGSETLSKADGGLPSWMKCYGCYQKGHKRVDCPKNILRHHSQTGERRVYYWESWETYYTLHES